MSRLPPSGGTCKYAKAPSTKKTLRDSLPIDILLSVLSILVVAQSSWEVPEGLMNNPVVTHCYILFLDGLFPKTEKNLRLPLETKFLN